MDPADVCTQGLLLLLLPRLWVATLCPVEGAGLAVDPMGHALRPYYCGFSQMFFARCPLRLLLYRPQYGGSSSF